MKPHSILPMLKFIKILDSNFKAKDCEFDAFHLMDKKSI